MFLDLTAIATNTIFALATPPGRSALAVIRVTGPRSTVVLQTMTGLVPSPRTAALRMLRHPLTHIPLDQALVLYFPAPASETGEDIAELQLHGGRAVIAAVLDALAQIPGCRMAEPGEFARRAFHNGKIDLTAAEGLADLIDAETEGQRSQALVQTSGALAKLYSGWRTQMIGAQALVEAAIDFSDEGDVGASAFLQAKEIVHSLEAAMIGHLGHANRGEILRSGFKVVLAGPPNVGKSSLLNALARRDVAIVSDEAGTTRDVIEARLDLAGIPVIVSDTAGVRTPTGAIEREGVRRTLERVGDADLVIWMIDAAKPGKPETDAAGLKTARASLRVVNKIDVGSTSIVADAQISVRTGVGIEELTKLITNRARAALGSVKDPAPTQERHRMLLAAALGHLATFLAAPVDQLELRAEDLRLAADALGRLTGRIDPEDVLAQIFGRFCIGK